MKMIHTIKVICLILPAVCFAQCGGSYGDFLDDPNNAGMAQWATTAKGSSGSCKFRAVAVDKEGNAYAVGFLNGSGAIDFGGNSKAFSGTSANSNALVVKYNSSGIAQWAKMIEITSGTSEFNGVGVDDSGNVYVVGFVQAWGGTVAFGGDINPFSLIDVNEHTVVVKYNSSGAAQWAAKAETSPNNSCFFGVAVDAVGNSYAVGSVQDGTYVFGGLNSTCTSTYVGNNTVIVKYNSSGVAQWAKAVNASAESLFSAVAVDGSGNAYAVGRVTGNSNDFSFGDNIPGIRGSSAVANTVIVKYNADGISQWAKAIKSGTAANEFFGVAVDRSGNACAVGNVTGQGVFNFGDDSEPFSGKSSGSNAVIVKYNSSGTAQWATSIQNGSTESAFKSVAVDVLGNPYAVGNVTGAGTYDFGGKSLPSTVSSGSKCTIIVKYDVTGAAQWATPDKDPSDANFLGAAVDRSGYAYAVGLLNTTGKKYDFGGKSTAFNMPSINTCPVVVKYY